MSARDVMEKLRNTDFYDVWYVYFLNAFHEQGMRADDANDYATKKLESLTDEEFEQMVLLVKSGMVRW